METTCNPLYGPPAEVTDWERFIIGNALMNKVVAELRMVAQFKEWSRDPEKHMGKYAPDPPTPESQIDEAVEREVAGCRQIYDLMCKYVPMPIAWETMLYWADKPFDKD